MEYAVIHVSWWFDIFRPIFTIGKVQRHTVQQLSQWRPCCRHWPLQTEVRDLVRWLGRRGCHGSRSRARPNVNIYKRSADAIPIVLTERFERHGSVGRDSLMYHGQISQHPAMDRRQQAEYCRSHWDVAWRRRISRPDSLCTSRLQVCWKGACKDKWAVDTDKPRWCLFHNSTQRMRAIQLPTCTHSELLQRIQSARAIIDILSAGGDRRRL